jgi:hypothetical protein
MIAMGKFGNDLIKSLRQAAGHARGRTVRGCRVSRKVVTDARAVGERGEPEEVHAADLPAMSEGLAQAERRQFSSDAEVKRAFRRFHR